MYVLKSLQQWIVQKRYNDPTQGHSGISKIIKLFSQNYYFPRMRKKVKRHINKRQKCQLNKHPTHTSYKYIQYAKIADYL